MKQSEQARAASLVIEASGWTPPTINRVLADVLSRPLAEAEAAWRGDISGILVPLGLRVPPVFPPKPDGRANHSDAFRWLWNEFTSVRRSDPEAIW